MTARIKPDVLQALQDWKAGKPVDTLEIGHVHRMKEVPGFSPTIDTSQHLHQDQDRAHAYVFHLIELFQLNGVPAEHEDFLKACDDYELTFDWGVEIQVVAGGGWRKDVEELNSERDAAESLAWKALRFGWARAI